MVNGKTRTLADWQQYVQEAYEHGVKPAPYPAYRGERMTYPAFPTSSPAVVMKPLDPEFLENRKVFAELYSTIVASGVAQGFLELDWNGKPELTEHTKEKVFVKKDETIPDFIDREEARDRLGLPADPVFPKAFGSYAATTPGVIYNPGSGI